MEHEISVRTLNVLWLWTQLGAEEVNGCLHGPPDQMAITILHTNTRAFFFPALVIEPQGKFASKFSPKLWKQTFQCKVRILTSETS